MRIYWPDHENKRLWIFIPKCASTSMRMAVSPGEKVDRQGALKYKDYYTIAFIRHPWDRLTSALHQILRDSDPFDERIDKWVTKPGRVDWMDMHVRPQSWFMEGFDIDFLGHVETMQEDWKRLQGLIDVPDIAHHGKGEHRPGRWQDIGFNWSALNRIYKRDLEYATNL